MKIIKHISEFTSLEKGQTGLGLTIGNFDGVHRGHRELIQSVRKECRDSNLSLVLMTFIPHPQTILFPPHRGFLINSYEERRQLLADLDIDYLVEVAFTRDFSSLSPRDFLDQYIFPPGHQVKKIFLGHDFTFGAGKAGDFDFVSAYCSKIGVEVFLQKEFRNFSQTISSSRIREFISAGDFPDCQKLLGREFSLSGIVVKSAGRGKKIGFPTANMAVEKDRILPRTGVYVTKTLHKDIWYQSITNVGRNPTFESGDHIHVETHIFEFDMDIYGDVINVAFFQKIREEKKFSGVEELVAQIQKDIAFCRDYSKKTV